MCILSFYAPFVEPDPESIHNGGLNNPDGHGWAVAVPGHRWVQVGKSMFLEEAIEGFLRYRARHPESHALFHSRYATHGVTDKSNAHPFRVSGDRRTIMAHNGILPRDAHPIGKDKRSDTRKFADSMLRQQWPDLDNKDQRKDLATWIGSYNKLVILTTDTKRYDHPSYLINASAGHWHRDVWYSNSDYRFEYRSWYTTKAVAPECLACTGPDIDESGYCMDCDTHQDCGMGWRACQCYLAEEKDEMDRNQEEDDMARDEDAMFETWLQERA